MSGALNDEEIKRYNVLSKRGQQDFRNMPDDEKAEWQSLGERYKINVEQDRQKHVAASHAKINEELAKKREAAAKADAERLAALDARRAETAAAETKE